MASNVANMKKAYDSEVLSEAQVIRGNTSGNWTSTLIRKYLRSYSLGPGPDQYGYGRSLNRYTRKDVKLRGSQYRPQSAGNGIPSYRGIWPRTVSKSSSNAKPRAVPAAQLGTPPKTL